MSLLDLNETPNILPQDFEKEARAVLGELAQLSGAPTSEERAAYVAGELLGTLEQEPGVLDILALAIKRVKDRAEYLTGDRLLSMMKTINAKAWTSPEGIKLEIKRKSSVTQKGCDPALLAGWLEAHDLGALIKDDLSFDKGALTPELIGELRERGLHFDRISEVNTANLKTVLDGLEASGGELPPPEAVNREVFEIVDIKFPRKKNG